MTQPPDFSKSNYNYWNRMRIATGRSSGESFGGINGNNSSVGTSFETLWEEQGIYEFPAAASQMTISSDNANDTDGGTGTRQVVIIYLTDDYTEAVEIVTLNGTTPVTTVASMFRVNAIISISVGSNKVNVGNIYIGTGTVIAGKPATVVNLMVADIGESRSAFTSIPKGITYHPIDYVITSEKDKPLELKFSFYNVFGGGEKIEDFQGIFNSGLSAFGFLGYGSITETDIRIDGRIASGSTAAGFFHIFGMSKIQPDE